MDILIFEDEKHTATKLKMLLGEIDQSLKVVAILGSVKEGIEWLKSHANPGLIFQDIRLSDGNCFELFDAIEISSPVVFTTAYSEYALKSFRVNSIDYIVKPYNKDEIEKALDKLKKMKNAFILPEKELLQEIFTKEKLTTKRRFLIKSGDGFVNVNSNDIAYFISEESVTFAVLFSGKRHIVNQSVMALSEQMDPERFFRISRKVIVNIESISKIHSWFNSRMKLQLKPPAEKEVIVSRERVKDFKEWLDK